MNNTKKAARFTASDFNIRLARPKGFCPGTAVPIASLTLVAAAKKQSTGLFFYAWFESLRFLVKRIRPHLMVQPYSLARPKGFCLGTAVPIASLTLVAAAKKQSGSNPFVFQIKK